MKQLSELSQQDKIKLAAELDGHNMNQCPCKLFPAHPMAAHISLSGGKLPLYNSSYDAIIPLIQKQSKDKGMPCWINDRLPISVYFHNAIPSQLLDALLVATGKASL